MFLDDDDNTGILDKVSGAAGDAAHSVNEDWKETKEDVERVSDGVSEEDKKELKENHMLGHDGDSSNE